MKKVFIIFILILAAVITVILILSKDSFKWDLNIFGDELKIDKTENVIEEIRKISELTTACYYQELVIKDYKAEPTILNGVSQAMRLGGDSTRYEIVLIAKGSVRAGFDLSNISKDNLSVDADTLAITLPRAQVMDVIVNPSDCEIYSEEGNWTNEEIANIKYKTSERLRRNALQDGLIEKAETSGVEKIKMFFKAFGFSNVKIHFSNND